MSCGVGHRCGSDPALLWLWYRLAAAAPIQPLAWEPSHAEGAALKRPKKKKKNTIKEVKTWSSHCSTVGWESNCSGLVCWGSTGSIPSLAEWVEGFYIGDFGTGHGLGTSYVLQVQPYKKRKEKKKRRWKHHLQTMRKYLQIMCDKRLVFRYTDGRCLKHFKHKLVTFSKY